MIKDIAAGAVLLSAVASLVIGVIIFLPKFF
jgi:diacylglycerol kinase